MKSSEQIEQLKANWCSDPCWDIEDTEGFEAHYDELREYRETCEAEWKARLDAEKQEQASKMGLTPDNPLFTHVQRLERQIESLERRMNSIQELHP